MLLIGSCFDQQIPQINSPPSDNISKIHKREACGQVSYIKGFWQHKNIVSFMECLGWDTKFPILHDRIVKLDTKHWSHLVGTIGSHFFDDRKRRDRLFKATRKLHTQGELGKLLANLTLWVEPKLWGDIADIITCAKSGENSTKCSSINHQNITHDELLALVRELDLDTETLSALFHLYSDQDAFSLKYGERLVLSLHQLIDDSEYQNRRLGLLDSLASKLQTGLTSDERQFMLKVLATPSTTKKETWLFEFIHGQGFTQSYFNSLMRFPYEGTTRPLWDYQLLAKSFAHPLPCNVGGKLDDVEQMAVDFRVTMSEFITKFDQLDQPAFFKFGMEKSSLLLLASEGCPVLRNYTGTIVTGGSNGKQVIHQLDLAAVLKSSVTLLQMEQHYQIAHYFSSIASRALSAETDENNGKTDFITHLLAEPVLLHGSEWVERADQLSTDSLPLFFLRLKSLPFVSYTAFLNIVERLVLDINQDSLKVAARVWLSLSSEAKLQLLNSLDRSLIQNKGLKGVSQYKLSLLQELVSLHPLLSDAWFSSGAESKTLDAVAHLLGQLATPEVSSELKLFLTEDRLLQIISIITNGVIPRNDGTNLLVPKPGHTNSGDPIYIIIPDHDAQQEAAAIADCISDLSSTNSNLYQSIITPPFSCSKLKQLDILTQMFIWMNRIALDYHTTETGENEVTLSANLFDRFGLFSPEMIGNTVANLKIIDQRWVSGQTSGVRYLVDSIKEHLMLFARPPGGRKPVQCKEDSCFGYLYEYEDFLQGVVDYFGYMGPQGEAHRNFLIAKTFDLQNVSIHQEFIANLTYLLERYAIEVLPENGSMFAASSTYSCSTFLNQRIGGDVCPNLTRIKKGIGKTLELATRRFGATEKSAIEYLVTATLPGKGIVIPVEHDDTASALSSGVYRPYRLTLRESFMMLYDLADRGVEANQQTVEYRQTRKLLSQQPMTTLERIEVVIRDIRFEHNYMGADYQNTVSKGFDYNSVVEYKRKWLRRCVAMRYCGKKVLRKDTLKMARNAREAFDGLLEANTRFGQVQPNGGYGNYMQALLGLIVRSSAPEARRVRTVNNIPVMLPKEDLLRHNGGILTEIALMGGASNIARVIHDRVGRSREQLVAFINSKAFSRVDQMLYHSFTVEGGQELLQQIGEKLLMVKDVDGKLLHELAVDWVGGLRYQEIRRAEEVAANLLVISTYLNEEGNLPFRFASLLPRLIELWPYLSRVMVKDEKLMSLIDGVAPLVKFVKMELLDKGNRQVLKLLNDLFGMAEILLLDKTVGTDGFTLLERAVLASAGDVLAPVKKIITSSYSYLHRLQLRLNQDGFWSENGQRLINIARRIKLLNEDPRFDLSPFRSYMLVTVKPCIGPLIDCQANYHYDEPYRLMRYLVGSGSNAETDSRLVQMSKELLINRKEELVKLIQDGLNSIILKRK